MLSFSTLTGEILKQLRGSKSPSSLDEEFNLGQGQYQRWESGRVQIKWDDFIFLCKKLKFPIAKALAESIQFTGNPFHYHLIVRCCTGSASQSAIGKQLGVTRYTVNRWMQGKAAPALLQLLQLLHLGNTRLPVFVQALMKDSLPASFKIYMQKTENALELIQKMPWISGILSALDLHEYKSSAIHSDDWLGHKLDLPPKTIKATLHALEKRDLIRWSNQHYQVTLNEINPAVLKMKAKHLLQFWMKKNQEAIEHCYPSPDRKSLSSYHVFSVDKNSGEAIKKLYIDFTKELSLLVNKSRTKQQDEIYSFTLSMINFEDFKK